MDENKIKEVLSEACKSEVPDNWNIIEEKVMQDTENSTDRKVAPVALGRNRRKMMGRIAVAAAFFLVLGGIGFYDALLKPHNLTGDQRSGFVLEAYADTTEEPTEITKDKDGTLSFSSSSVSIGFSSSDGTVIDSSEYIVILKPGGKDYKDHTIKSIKNGTEITADGTVDSNGRSLEISDGTYSITIEDASAEEGESVYGRAEVRSSGNETGDMGSANYFAISSDGTKIVTAIIEVTYTDGTTEEFTLTLTPTERTEEVEMGGTGEDFIPEMKWVDFDISLE